MGSSCLIEYAQSTQIYGRDERVCVGIESTSSGASESLIIGLHGLRKIRHGLERICYLEIAFPPIFTFVRGFAVCFDGGFKPIESFVILNAATVLFLYFAFS